jgi:hypothetical protein
MASPPEAKLQVEAIISRAEAEPRKAVSEE